MSLMSLKHKLMSLRRKGRQWWFMVANTCSARRADGQPCRAMSTRSGYCPAHDPVLTEKVRDARRAGGHGKSRSARAAKLLPDDLLVLDQVLDSAIAGIYRGSLVSAQGQAIASLTGAKIRLRELALRIKEQIELEDRIQRLEAILRDTGNTRFSNGATNHRARH
jgi:hypothetical protein